MADFIISAVAEGIVSRLLSLAAEEATLAWGFKDAIKTLQERMETTVAFLSYAESKSANLDIPIEHWLKKLKGAVYDADVLLDRLHYEVLRQQIDAQGKVHKGAAKWKNKEFPRYEELCIVFGKDRAQGNKARDFVEMEKEANIEEQTQHLDDDSDDIMETSNIPCSHSNVQPDETSSARNKKRKSRVDPMVEGFNDAVMYLGDTLEKISNKMNKGIEREEEFDKKSAMITTEISKMQSLTQIDRFKAITKIRKDPERVKVFWDLVESDREAFVKFILEE